MRSTLGFVLLVASAVSLTGCKKQIVLRKSAVPQNRAQATYWLCEAGRDTCVKGDAVDESEWKQSGTARLPLPSCPGGLAKVLIRNPGRPKHAKVYAVCLDPKMGDQPCPGGVAPVPSPSGGMTCPEEASDD